MIIIKMNNLFVIKTYDIVDKKVLIKRPWKSILALENTYVGNQIASSFEMQQNPWNFQRRPLVSFCDRPCFLFLFSCFCFLLTRLTMLTASVHERHKLYDSISTFSKAAKEKY